MAFEVPESAQKLVLRSACQKWREFKSKLTTKYILAHADQPHLLKHPPADYSFIEKAHWDKFVAMRTTPEFLVIKFLSLSISYNSVVLYLYTVTYFIANIVVFLRRQSMKNTQT